MDPLVTFDGAEQLPAVEETTAGRIVAAGGAARASAVSVTDGDGVRALFAELVDEFGRLDAVINVAGISRPTSLDRWQRGGLAGRARSARRRLPQRARSRAADHGGGGSRPHPRRHVRFGLARAGDAGAYGCAKRAVASLTWQLGRAAAAGCVGQRDVADRRDADGDRGARARGRAAGSAAATGPLFGSMPEPEQIGPIGAYLVRDEFDWCSGEVIFGSGAEVAVVDQPRLLEVVRSDYVKSLAPVLDAVTAGAFASAEAQSACAVAGRTLGSRQSSTRPMRTPNSRRQRCGRVRCSRIVRNSTRRLRALSTGRGIEATWVKSVDDLAAIPSLDAVLVGGRRRHSRDGAHRVGADAGRARRHRRPTSR